MFAGLPVDDSYALAHLGFNSGEKTDRRNRTCLIAFPAKGVNLRADLARSKGGAERITQKERDPLEE